MILRGENTNTGQPGYCLRCHVWCAEGPDPCLGYLPGVSHACCGHGVTERAYVALGGEPDQDGRTVAGGVEILRGGLALRYFGMAA